MGIRSIVFFSLLVVSISLGVLGCSSEVTSSPAQDRPLISKKDDLPRHSYSIGMQAVDLYLPENRASLMALAAQLRADIESDLASYNIQDANTLQGFYADLGSVALMEKRWQDYLDLLDKRRELETKLANKLTMGLLGEAVAKAHLMEADDVSAQVKVILENRLSELPYATVQDNLKSTKGSSEILSRALVLGSIESGVQPVLDNTNGEMSYDIAARLVGSVFTLDHFIPLAGMVGQIYGDVIAANKIEKQDIW